MSCKTLLSTYRSYLPKRCTNEKAAIRKGNGGHSVRWPIAKEIVRLGIGQCIVIKEKVIVAVEALEGTDEAIRRGGSLGKSDIVVIKVSKHDFDPRFDIPSVGLETIKTLKEASASVLALEAGKTLILDIEETIKAADQANIAIIGM